MKVVSPPHQVRVVVNILSIVAHFVDRYAARDAVKKLDYLAVGGSEYWRAARRHDVNSIMRAAVRSCRSERIDKLASFYPFYRDQQNVRRHIAWYRNRYLWHG